MKTFIIKLKSGLTCELDAENKKSLFKKIGSGNYGILPIRDDKREKISSKNIETIIEKVIESK